MLSPRVTVLMPVYNAELYLEEAVRSILNQSYKNFDFLIINDGSTDKSNSILERLASSDERIRLIKQENQGIIKTLNTGFQLADGEFIARMDADDIAHVDRLERQIEFMDQRPEIGVCGTWIKALNHPHFDTIKYYEKHESICLHMFRLVAFAHPTVLIRKTIIDDNELEFNPDYLHAEDYEFWRIMAKHTRLANIPEIHLDYRFHNAQISALKKEIQINTANRVRRNILEDLTGEVVSDEQFSIHQFITFKGNFVSVELEKYEDWINKYYKAATKSKIYNLEELKDLLTRGYFRVLLEFTSKNKRLSSRLKKAPFYCKESLTFKQHQTLLVKNLLNR